MTALDKARAYRRDARGRKTKASTSEHADVAVAWAHGELELTAVAVGLGLPPGNRCYSAIARGLRHAVATGRLVLP